MTSDLNRRDFLKLAAGAGAALAMPTPAHPSVSPKMIGIQVGAVSFVDEGTEKVLDVLQERGCVNTLVSGGIHLRSRNCRQADSRPAAARSWQAGVRPQLSRRELRHASSPVLQEHGSQGHPRARSRQPGYPGRSSPGGQKARHESHLLAGGCVSHRPAEHRESAGAGSVRAECRDAVRQQSGLSKFPDRPGRGLCPLL